MNPERILLPLDIRKWPVEVFSVVNGLANHPGVSVILLHVVTLSITAPRKASMKRLAGMPTGTLNGWPADACARGSPRPLASGLANRRRKY